MAESVQTKDSDAPATSLVDPATIAKPPESGDVSDIISAIRPTATAPSANIPQDVIAAQEAKVKAEDKIYSSMFGLANEDSLYARRILNAEGVNPDDVRPWNADAERRKYESDPIQSFGSIGSVFAVIASAFTRTPMVNALNGSAAAMEAIKTGNEKEYERAYRAHKDNTELAIKRSQLMHQKYQDAMELMKTNMALGEAKARAVATQFGDLQTLGMMREGMWTEFFQAQSARADATLKLGEVQDQTRDRMMKNWDINQRMDAIAKSPGSRTEKMQKMVSAVKQWHQDWDPRYARLGPHTTLDYKIQVKKQQWEAEHPGEAMTPDVESGIIDSANREFKEAGSRNQISDDRVNTIVKGIKAGELPPSLAGYYGAARGKIEAELGKEGVNLVGMQLEQVRANKEIAALNSTQMTRFVGVSRALINTIDLAKESAQKLQLGGIAPLNQAHLSWLVKYRGNTEQGRLAAKYLTDVNAVKEEFANVATGGYAPTDSVWQLANQQINTAYGVLELSENLDEVKRIMKYRINSIPGMGQIGPGAPNRYLPGVEAKPLDEEPAKSGDGWTNLPNGVRIREKK